jgi:hypothetical protein
MIKFYQNYAILLKIQNYFRDLIFIYRCMKYIKLFEDFITDEDRGKDATFDHSNSPVLRQEVKKYVDTILHSNQFKVIFDALGIEVPKDISADGLDAMFDDVEEQAIEFFIKNPERMTNDTGGDEIKKMPVDTGSNDNRIPSISNTGTSTPPSGGSGRI